MSTHDVDGLNAGYARALLDEYLENPEAVPSEWRALFESGDSQLVATHPGIKRLLELLPRDGGNGANGGATAAPPAPEPASVDSTQALDPQLLGGVAAAMALVKAHRTHGHLAARLDPLGSEPVGDPSLEPLRLEPKLTPELQARIPASYLRVHVPGTTLADVLPKLGETYCGTIAYELEHLSDHQQRVWLRQAIESGRYRQSLSADEKKTLFRRLCEVEGMERFLRKRFLGQKQFSLEGLDVMIPMLDETIELASEAGAHEVVMGMAHRGRLNVLAHTIGMPYEYILREFEGERTIEAVASDPEGGTGDVKYHLAAHGTRTTANGKVGVRLVANPSHLEAVDPVVVGRTRAEQTDRSTRNGAHDPSVALAVLLHGDAAFAGQGVVAETFNVHDLAGYSTGGTLHLITNNQIGFTTDPNEGRSTRYSSDLAKGFDVPIIHVNADDPEASIAAVRLSMAYRRRFGQDVVIDLVGYRRFGHNEQDEAAYTQPLMVEQITAHASVRELYEEQLIAEGVLTRDEAEGFVSEVESVLRAAHERLKASFGDASASKVEHDGAIPRSTTAEPVTAVAADTLRGLTDELLSTPDDFTVHPKLAKQLERRRTALAEGGIDWGQAESLAFASLLVDGIPIRLTGQDSQRGTFSQRHLVLHDVQTGETYTPMQHLEEAHASFEVYNSPLSEYACMGFEYGYSAAAPEALVLWEAQYGDFANGAQIVIDQFISSALSKWRETSRLTLLLPHGYEGNGPEHSSARLERFLQLAAQENIRIANCTTAAQYFHLLRRQALDATARPLVVVTPKGLLRLKEATSTLADLADGGFRPVLDDPRAEKDAVRRLVLCSGKIYYDVVGHEARTQAGSVAVARIEQLYPFPTQDAAEVVASYPALDEVVWVQEEPQNMGPWRSLRHRLEEAAAGVPLRFAGRPWRASPSEGYPTAHLIEQDRIVREALTV
ncbi:MAG: 2-oxoglutarate dehydrogenase E1 component [Thermoleophilia bacterium]|nr:2-oxoglutarate dehydrogenase E1 component [Thermoleophilia bacterium]